MCLDECCSKVRITSNIKISHTKEERSSSFHWNHWGLGGWIGPQMPIYELRATAIIRCHDGGCRLCNVCALGIRH